jgi:hypothetical protein
MTDKAHKITHEGVLTIGEMQIPCYVLSNGTRVISAFQMQEALKLFPAKYPRKSSSRLARLLGYKALKPLIDTGFTYGHFEPIECFKGDKKINGYAATVLVDICDVMLSARRNKKINLTERQKVIADQCEILVRSFAKVGIIALIDEATGYQYEREQKELQFILKTFISDDILSWQKTFHNNFYKEIYRLWNIPYTPENIRTKPQFIGKLTNELVYKNLPQGTFVLEKLKEKTPKTKGGNWRYKLHQSLTPEVGREQLKKVIYSVETLAAVSNTKQRFRELVQDRYGQRIIPFNELETK